MRKSQGGKLGIHKERKTPPKKKRIEEKASGGDPRGTVEKRKKKGEMYGKKTTTHTA